MNVDGIKNVDLVIAGAGWCGMGTAAGFCSSIQGVLPKDEQNYGSKELPSFIVLESGNCVGGFWNSQYARLHFHSIYHRLPFAPSIRANYPPHLSKDNIVSYFKDYASYFQFSSNIKCNSKLSQVRKLPEENKPYEWEILIKDKENPDMDIKYHCKFLSISTGFHRVPKLPNIPGISLFEGDCIHSSGYYDGSKFKDKRVLVIGAGNSAIDIIMDLYEFGAIPEISIRSTRHIVSQNIDYIGTVMTDRVYKSVFLKSRKERHVAKSLLNYFEVDLPSYGLEKPDPNLFDDPYYIPNIDQGFTNGMKEKKFKVISSGVKEITKTGVIFDNNTKETYDAIIMATGYTTGLEEYFEKDLTPKLLEQRKEFQHHQIGWIPKTDVDGNSLIYPSLYFVGYQPHAVGWYNGYAGWLAGEQIANQLTDGKSTSIMFPTDSKLKTTLMVLSGLTVLPVAIGGLYFLFKQKKSFRYSKRGK